MLRKYNIQEQFRLNAPRMREYGINKIGLFGSFVRQEQQADSDIDILVDFQDHKENFDNFMAICDLLEKMFKGYNVEVVTVNGLSPYIGPHILNSVEYVQIAN